MINSLCGSSAGAESENRSDSAAIIGLDYEGLERHARRPAFSLWAVDSRGMCLRNVLSLGLGLRTIAVNVAWSLELAGLKANRTTRKLWQ